MATVTVPTDQSCDLILVSNADPDLSLGYQENGDTMPHAYTRANTGTLTKIPIAGRTKPIAFRNNTGDADVFTRTLIVDIDTAGHPLTNLDRVVFGPLIALIEAEDIPCVTLLDGHGFRWYTAPEFVQGTYTYTGHEHSADVTFNEVDGGPFPVVTASPWT